MCTKIHSYFKLLNARAFLFQKNPDALGEASGLSGLCVSFSISEVLAPGPRTGYGPSAPFAHGRGKGSGRKSHQFTL